MPIFLPKYPRFFLTYTSTHTAILLLSWVENTSVLLRVCLSIAFQIFVLVFSPNSLIGSSDTIIFESLASALTSANLFFSPPLRVLMEITTSSSTSGTNALSDNSFKRTNLYHDTVSFAHSSAYMI